MNRDLNLSSENPFLYSRLITEFMRYCPNFGYTPLIFTFWADDELVGLVPLKLRTRHTLNHVSNLFDALYSDFFLSIKTRELCITQMIDFLFKRLNCSSISLTLSNPSTLDLIKNICLTKKIHFITSPFMGSSIIPIETDWKSFYDSLNAKVRKEFQRRKKALSHLGPLKTVSSEITSESIKKIHSVEQTSWKHNWRKQHGITEDSTLNPILRASKPDEKTNPIYASEVWFLESAGQPIAYTLVLLYKETGFLVKTSYNSEFKKSVPSIFLGFC